MTIRQVRRNVSNLYFSVTRGIYWILVWLHKTFDLLDVVLCSAFLLITSGVYMLWGKGWACITLGSLLLLLVVIGLPVKQGK